MNDTSLRKYRSKEFAQALFVAKSKEGKTAFLTAQALGLFPGQQHGGVVTAPNHLHLLTFDSAALVGLDKFLIKTCGGKPEDVGQVHVMNFESDVSEVAEGKTSHNYAFFNEVMKARDDIKASIKPDEVHAIIVSSLTGLAAALQRAISGPPTKKSSMDINKWSMYGEWIAELRNYFQVDDWHMLWEGHVVEKTVIHQDKPAETTEELPLHGGSKNFPYNVSQVFRIRRSFGVRPKDEDGKNLSDTCDVVYLDTKPSYEFLSGGRGFNESLSSKEFDLTSTFKKLNLKVGGWNAPKKIAASSVAK